MVWEQQTLIPMAPAAKRGRCFIGVEVNPAWLSILDSYAQRHGETRSDIVREALIRHLMDDGIPLPVLN